MAAKKQSNVWARGLHHVSDLLIKRGSAMGPLLPPLFLVPVFLGSVWVFRDVQILAGLFGLAAVGIVVHYLWEFARFARRDPDRLQSEEYRYEMKRIQMIAAKELAYPIPADVLPISPETANPAHPLPSPEEFDARAKK